jgi:cytochrome c biogenesis protein
LPYNKSRVPQAPAFVFLITGPGLPEDGEVFMYFARDVDKERFNQDALNGRAAELLDIGAESMDDVELSRFTSYLNIRVDKALPVILSGALLFIVGVVMGIYWQHRRIWMQIEGTKWLVAAHTNKNWHGLRNELADTLTQSGIAVDPKQLDNRGSQ